MPVFHKMIIYSPSCVVTNSLHNGQSKSKATKSFIDIGIALLESVKNFRQSLGCNTYDCVDYFYVKRVDVGITRAYGDATIQRCELHRVANQIPKDLLDPRWIAIHVVTTRVELELDLSAQGNHDALDDGNCLFEEVMCVDDPAMQLHLGV